MEIIIHRVNKINKLKKIPVSYGVEIDLRSYKKKIILNHKPKQTGDSLDDFLAKYKHGTLVLNIKEAGIENEVINKVKKKGIKKFFLLDVEIPYLFSCLKKKNKYSALRTSYYEPIEGLKKYKKIYNWLWLDSINTINFTKKDINIVKKFKICFVCPERWGKSYQIDYYKKYFKRKKIKLDAVMTSKFYAKKWLSD